MNHALTDDTEAIAAAVAGDHEAYGALVERYQEVAFRTAYLVVRDGAAAEDVAQEAFIRAFRGLRSFRSGQPFRPWLLRIVTNLALNETRADRRRSGLAEREAALAPRTAAPADAEVAAAADSALVLEAINRLAADDRVVLYLRYFVELPEREMAAALGVAQGTVKSRLHRASARLREVIERDYPGLREPADG